MKTYRVTYHYLATGMKGRADEQDYGTIQATSAEEACKEVAYMEFPDNEHNRKWMESCLTATLISD